ncbi:MAG TPA: hypothetical protein VFR37_16515 [Longimicrobium sp.]|nr:hypothetical protein [Longimicrobium sp.]
MKHFLCLLVCLSLPATGACSADAIAGPEPVAPAPAEPEPELRETVAPRPEPAPPVIFRCVRSLRIPSEPLYVIDDTISTQRDILVKIDGDAIDSIQVMKGAEAAPIYGTRAAAGAILITTRNAQRPAER